MKTIPNYPDYAITKDGRVWSKKGKGRWLKPVFRGPVGYLSCCLCKNGKTHAAYVHRLILETYVGPCPSGMECRHLNGKHLDNRLENLCWGTRLENVQDQIRHGIKSYGVRSGEDCPLSKLSQQEIQEIRDLYKSGLFTQTEIAKYYNVWQTAISAIVRRKTWK